MIVKVLDLEKDKVRLIIKGEGHTFMNALVEELLNDPDVDVATYMIEFQFSDPKRFFEYQTYVRPGDAFKAVDKISSEGKPLKEEWVFRRPK